MRVPKIIFASLVVAALSPAGASGQAHTFTNKSVDYVIEFPSNKWRSLASSGIIPARTRKAFIYEDGGNVRLLVRRKLVDAHVTPTDMVRRRQLWDKHLSGYILKKEEPFDGRLRGTKFSYEYVQGGKVMSALIYYLEADNRTIYSLLFTGTSGELESLDNQTDAIARSFRMKNSRR